MHMHRQRPRPDPEPERQTHPEPESETYAQADSDKELLDMLVDQHLAAAQQSREYNKALEMGLQEVREVLKANLRESGYLPPEPSPLVAARTLSNFAQEARERMEGMPTDDYSKAFVEAIATVEQELASENRDALDFVFRLSAGMRISVPAFSKAAAILKRLDSIIDRAKVSTEPPVTSPQVAAKMQELERFLSQHWTADARRGILAIHADEESQTTVLQIGIARYGPIYITVPRVLRPEDVALRSLRELLGRAGVFQDEVDPLAVIDGSYQRLNFNSIFAGTRVIRAPSGDTSRLAANLQKTAQRERLSRDNTVIINSAPATREQYRAVFPQDRTGQHWAAWGGEAEEWNRVTENAKFGHTAEASRETVLQALTQKENVIVLVAHSDGETLFMPDPRPNGTTISGAYLREHREEIAANSPFVYLFCCEAGDLSNLENFASTLLDCGAAGVVASQTILGAAEGRKMLGRLLEEDRGAPPIEDFWQAVRDTEFSEMEVFLA